jgi:hypothetical protein
MGIAGFAVSPQNVRIPGFDAEVHLPASRTPKQGKQFLIHMLKPGNAVIGNRKFFPFLEDTERFDPSTVKGEQVVIEKYMPYAEIPVQIFQVLVDIGRGIGAETAFENRPVAVAALVGTSPA